MLKLMIFNIYTKLLIYTFFDVFSGLKEILSSKSFIMSLIILHTRPRYRKWLKLDIQLQLWANPNQQFLLKKCTCTCLSTLYLVHLVCLGFYLFIIKEKNLKNHHTTNKEHKTDIFNYKKI